MAARRTQAPLIREIGTGRPPQKKPGRGWRIALLLFFVLIAAIGSAALVYFRSPCPSDATQVGNRPPLDNQLWCEIKTADGKTLQHGPRISWYPNGALKEEGHFLENKKVGEWHSWYPDGRPQRSQVFVDGQLHGTETWWHENGAKWSENHWNHGEQDGRWTEWYENGQMKEMRTRTDEENHELFTSWYENGNKKEEGEFVDGNRAGQWSGWSENGDTQYAGEFVANKREGPWTFWDDTGKRAEGLMVQDLKHQAWTIYDENNNPIEIQEYNNGELVSANPPAPPDPLTP